MKLGNCTENCFILSMFIIAKPDGSMKLALNSNIKKLIYANRYQMPKMNELVHNGALAISGNTAAPIWFLSIDLMYVYSQMKLRDATSRQCNFSFVGDH